MVGFLRSCAKRAPLGESRADGREFLLPYPYPSGTIPFPPPYRKAVPSCSRTLLVFLAISHRLTPKAHGSCRGSKGKELRARFHPAFLGARPLSFSWFGPRGMGSEQQSSTGILQRRLELGARDLFRKDPNFLFGINPGVWCHPEVSTEMNRFSPPRR